ncbi:hypothetical protein CEXT_582231 [Caerostris extrusa]|uniref:Uncharacterized protein n=1 Tax=Caerostris extrusa TaxID=172846 RepID=A0AAV4MCW1_CAEEX|nr:hypothetical protein CEXT_582231 [Caerostris extrusa]
MRERGEETCSRCPQNVKRCIRLTLLLRVPFTFVIKAPPCQSSDSAGWKVPYPPETLIREGANEELWALFFNPSPYRAVALRCINTPIAQHSAVPRAGLLISLSLFFRCVFSLNSRMRFL